MNDFIHMCVKLLTNQVLLPFMSDVVTLIGSFLNMSLSTKQVPYVQNLGSDSKHGNIKN